MEISDKYENFEILGLLAIDDKVYTLYRAKTMKS